MFRFIGNYYLYPGYFISILYTLTEVRADLEAEELGAHDFLIYDGSN